MFEKTTGPALTAGSENNNGNGHDFTVALELPRLIERMQRRYLDALAAMLPTFGADDIGPIPFLILVHIASSGQDAGIAVRELSERGYYQGSNLSYNLKQLDEHGYIERSTSLRDKRSTKLKLTERALKLLAAVREREVQILTPLLDEYGGPEACETTYKLLRKLESAWATALRAEEADVLHFIE